jgi:hypothetical protein
VRPANQQEDDEIAEEDGNLLREDDEIAKEDDDLLKEDGKIVPVLVCTWHSTSDAFPSDQPLALNREAVTECNIPVSPALGVFPRV